MTAPSPQPRAGDALLEVGAARLRFRDEGQGPALLLIHGWAFDLEVWEPRARSWAARWRVIRHDRRGFGGSSGEPSIARDAEDALAVLEHLKVSRAVLVGASQGSRAALRAALAAPERVAALVLDGPSDELSTEPQLPLDEYRRLARGGQMAAVRALWSSHPFTRLHTSDPAARALLDGCIARYPGNDLLGPETRAPSVALEACVCPVLIVNGALDLEPRRVAGSALARALPLAEHVSIPGAGHLPHLDQPDAYDAAVLPFIARALAVPPAGSAGRAPSA